jgi:tetratricopeptide (TPR) repeat protein
MLTEKFYDILDNEIDAIIDRYKKQPAIAKHKDINQKKSYAFLVWFLEFYGRLSSFKDYITNGTEDASCDIIFDRTDSLGDTAFYIVQAKWFNRKNALGNISAKDVKYSLNDFETIIRGDIKKTRNEEFNIKYRALLEHLNKNGKVKFIFLALARGSDEYKKNLESFNKNNEPNSTIEIIDIERIKRDYIDLKYKGIKKETPLDIHADPDNSKISLRIERFTDVSGKGDIIKKSGVYRAYVVMVKPKVIHKLFKDFGFLLFYRNVRNPLPESNFNTQIANTLKEQPALFWYYNNGITAISRLVPEIGNEALEIEITGLQVINGAQTVYSVYREYEDASPRDREVMDKDALIMLRLVDSSDKDFNFKITRYTNSQNPMVSRDFHANDDVQIRLQNESFDYTYWYEKRRGEFRREEVPQDIRIVENQTFACAYLAFFLEDVHGAVINNHLLFISRDINQKKGLYETVFTPHVRFEDMLASYLIVEQILGFISPNLIYTEEGKTATWDLQDERVLLALAVAPLFKLVFKEYLSMKLSETADQINLTTYLLKRRIENYLFDNIITYTIYHLNLVDSRGKINLTALKGKDAVRQIVDIVHRKKTDELEQLLYIRKMGVEFFEQDNPDEFSDILATQVEKSITPDEPKIKNLKVIKLMNDVLRLRKEKRYDTALFLFESIDGIERGNWYIYLEWGITYKEINDYDQAIIKLQKALEFASTDIHKSRIYTELGVIFQENNMANQALVAFEKAENLDRDNAELYEKWAFLNHKMGRHQDAMNKMTMAIKLDENNEVYKWKFEFYAKKFLDKNFTLGLGKFLESKKQEQSNYSASASHRTSAQPFSNNPINFKRFVNRHKPREIVEGEIIHINSSLGIFVRLGFNVNGLIRKKRLPVNFDVSPKFKIGQKIKVTLLFIQYDRYQIELDIAHS